MKYLVYPMLVVFLYFFSCIDSTEESPMHIMLDSKAYVSVKLENINSPININFAYWPNLSPERIELPSLTIETDTIVVFELTANMPQKHYITIDTLSVPVFVSLSDTSGISFNGINNNLEYDSKNVSINKYYLSTDSISKSLNMDRMRAYHNDQLTWEECFNLIDSIKQYETDLLQSSEIKIPNWFKDLEMRNIEFTAAHFKLSAPNYRNFLNAGDDNVLSDSQLNFLKDIDLKSPDNKYLNQYYNFMNFYAFYLAFGPQYVNSDSVTRLFHDVKFSTKMFELIESTDIAPENLLAFEIHQTISDFKRNLDRKNGRLKYLEEKYGQKNLYVKYLLKEHQQLLESGLKPGDPSPEFYLIDKNGDYVSLNQQYGNTVLLNIYTKGCVSCIKEAPFEKALLAQFEDHQFRIINICVTDSKEIFQKAVSKFQLEGINVYTQEKWGPLIKKKYGVQGFPHYVLISKEGRIVMNNTYKPSNPKLTELILSSL